LRVTYNKEAVPHLAICMKLELVRYEETRNP